MKTLTKKEKKEFEEIMQNVGKTLIATMNVIEAENFIQCQYVSGDDTYILTFTKSKP
jgi:hypothetical protein